MQAPLDLGLPAGPHIPRMTAQTAIPSAASHGLRPSTGLTSLFAAVMSHIADGTVHRAELQRQTRAWSSEV